MKMLLDEHYSSRIAKHLRGRGFEVVAVSEETGLLAMGDADLLEWARGQRRVLLTENVQDFMPLHERFLSQGELHEGIVFTSPRRFPRSTAGIGKLVAALAALLTDHPGEGRLKSTIRWL